MELTVTNREENTTRDAPRMTLFHHRACPHSRFVRIVLGEYAIAVRLYEERVWERRNEFLLLNPAGTTPILVEEGRPTVSGAESIAEYLDETRGAEFEDRRLMPLDIGGRVEVRRLMNWFHVKFFDEVTSILVLEKVYKRCMTPDQGSGPVDVPAIRTARNNIRYHLGYLGWLTQKRHWLAGERMTYSDLAAAAHLSCADYLGEVPWSDYASVKHWYARMKSRPSLRSILADVLPGPPPSPDYRDPDF
jgi:glutathione S-transferase